MNPEDLMRKYKYGYIFSKDLLERQFVKDLLKENKQLKDNWNEVKKDLRKIRQLTFTKYNKNEWENCLSFNDDIEPILDKMKELEQESDNIE